MNPSTIDPNQANTFLTVTLPIYITLALAIGGAIITVVTSLWAKWKELSARVDRQGERIDTHSDRIHDIALQTTPSGTTTIEVAPVAASAPLKSGTGLGVIALLALVILSGCASDGSLTPQGQQDVRLGLAVLNTAIDTYAQIDSAKTDGKKLSNAQIAQLAKNDLNGVLVQMQGNVGVAPDAANKGEGVAIGAANPIVGDAIQASLPQGAISQSTINQIAMIAK